MYSSNAGVGVRPEPVGVGVPVVDGPELGEEPPAEVDVEPRARRERGHGLDGARPLGLRHEVVLVGPVGRGELERRDVVGAEPEPLAVAGVELALDDEREPGRVDEPQLVGGAGAPDGNERAGVGEGLEVPGVLHLVGPETGRGRASRRRGRGRTGGRTRRPRRRRPPRGSGGRRGGPGTALHRARGLRAGHRPAGRGTRRTMTWLRGVFGRRHAKPGAERRGEASLRAGSGCRGDSLSPRARPSGGHP